MGLFTCFLTFVDFFLTKSLFSKIFGPDFAYILSMKQVITKTLSKSQKKRLFQWEIPHLIYTLKKEQGLAFTHLQEPVALPPNTTENFVFNGHICFPLFAGRESLGLLLCFHSLSAKQKKQIRRQIDSFLLISIGETLKGFPTKALCLNQGNQKQRLIEFSFPLLLKSEKQSSILKQAHKIYLKTPSFAFVHADDLKWQKGLFQNMNGVFVCVPFFHKLSDHQKHILEQELSQKNLPCRVVMGLRQKDTLPKKWESFFHQIATRM